MSVHGWGWPNVFAKLNHGSAMGPCHACDYVDIFMGELDRELVSHCPVPLLSSRAPPRCKKELMYLAWSRFRADGITILPNAEYVSAFEQHLQNLHPPDIKWVVTHGKEAEYLDVKLHTVNGLIETDVFRKNCHSYLPPVVMPHLSSRGSFQEWVRGCACFAPMIKLSRKD